jgi:hypothetical protein
VAIGLEQRRESNPSLFAFSVRNDRAHFAGLCITTDPVTAFAASVSLESKSCREEFPFDGEFGVIIGPQRPMDGNERMDSESLNRTTFRKGAFP